MARLLLQNVRARGPECMLEPGFEVEQGLGSGQQARYATEAGVVIHNARGWGLWP